MNKCFVIQPFDGGKFDKRFDDVFAPAIHAANLEPYRVDRDPGATIPIEDIQSGIESSRACLADITSDNPNVWFELGYAIASQRAVVLICSDERPPHFPFDVQHRNIIRYSTDSRQDYDQLALRITERLQAIIEKEGRLGDLARMSSVAAVEGLEQYELATLVAVAQQAPEPTSGVSAYSIQQDMQKAGFTEIAATLGLRGLLAKQMLEMFEDEDYQGQPFSAYRVTERGMTWLFQNTDKLKLKADPPREPTADGIPF